MRTWQNRVLINEASSRKVCTKVIGVVRVGQTVECTMQSVSTRRGEDISADATQSGYSRSWGLFDECSKAAGQGQGERKVGGGVSIRLCAADLRAFGDSSQTLIRLRRRSASRASNGVEVGGWRGDDRRRIGEDDQSGRPLARPPGWLAGWPGRVVLCATGQGV